MEHPGQADNGERTIRPPEAVGRRGVGRGQPRNLALVKDVPMRANYPNVRESVPEINACLAGTSSSYDARSSETDKDKEVENPFKQPVKFRETGPIIKAVFRKMESENAQFPYCMNKMFTTIKGHLIRLNDFKSVSALLTLIRDHQSSIVGNVVLDLGCGTGIRSVWCAALGAKMVIAADSSPFVGLVSQLAVDNKLADRVIAYNTGSLLNAGTASPLKQLLSSVDVIVCDWCGHGFFRGNLVDQIISASSFCSRTPLILPSVIRLSICASSSDEYHRETKRWNNAYNIDFSGLQENDLSTPIYGGWVEAQAICSTSDELYTYDLHGLVSQPVRDWGFTSEFSLRPQQIPQGLSVPVTAFVVHFEILSDFGKTVILSTEPSETRSRYGHCILCLANPPDFGNRNELNGRFTFIPRSGNDPMFILEYAVDSEDVQCVYYGIDPEVPFSDHSRK
ncbi:protein arginine N-methyltransferase 1-like [Paramacrobiotus metropolitanus]|uniref:protein arginine N-methyltransferase 1-like n=1 Tax=Paramacrobiotus metropolitanus TaxID=2943436 RepID=UPI002445C5A5|nr:protein arginine N-methyltransferase 1-like [Paramacrobiotus metropolitanus]